MDKVWVATSGSYSDYHIVAVFADERTAKAFVDGGGAEDAEEWELRRALPESKQVLDMWCTVADDSQRLLSLTLQAYHVGVFGKPPEEPLVKPLRAWEDHVETKTVWETDYEWPPSELRSTDPTGRRAPIVGVGRVHVWGTDFERVRKVYGDLTTRAQIFYETFGPETEGGDDG